MAKKTADTPRFRVTRVRARKRSWQEQRRSPYSRVYIHPVGENVWNQLFNRHARPYTVWRKHVMPRVLKKLGLPADTKFRWSKHAGCSMCPCSPGFILHAEVKERGPKKWIPNPSQIEQPCDIWVDVTGLPRINEEKARASNKFYPEFGSVAENAG